MYFNLRYKNVAKIINWGNLENLRKKDFFFFFGQVA